MMVPSEYGPVQVRLRLDGLHFQGSTRGVAWLKQSILERARHEPERSLVDIVAEMAS